MIKGKQAWCMKVYKYLIMPYRDQIYKTCDRKVICTNKAQFLLDFQKDSCVLYTESRRTTTIKGQQGDYKES